MLASSVLLKIKNLFFFTLITLREIPHNWKNIEIQYYNFQVLSVRRNDFGILLPLYLNPEFYVYIEV